MVALPRMTRDLVHILVLDSLQCFHHQQRTFQRSSQAAIQAVEPVHRSRHIENERDPLGVHHHVRRSRVSTPAKNMSFTRDSINNSAIVELPFHPLHPHPLLLLGVCRLQDLPQSVDVGLHSCSQSAVQIPIPRSHLNLLKLLLQGFLAHFTRSFQSLLGDVLLRFIGDLVDIEPFVQPVRATFASETRCVSSASPTSPLVSANMLLVVVVPLLRRRRFPVCLPLKLLPTSLRLLPGRCSLLLNAFDQITSILGCLASLR
mmetsp:Transcript_65109/g.174541  ORF Transcript_65109/g.174541 Transcript_65109/m.174541 type:complete len:260 (-) Transcript_65109:4537-5316(-)